ncbi:extracellular solute-binding protein [Roseovarius sp. ZX-A-9]|uniref:extracellular solute-binding protein n=1 Tax=Roseovarius sp. ZX-A-9 TaxID=3014783 RepID=UPI00232DA72D|nr:extracellular solute-binding protein [Roseovarius sp. ZX-A-9]
MIRRSDHQADHQQARTAKSRAIAATRNRAGKRLVWTALLGLGIAALMAQAALAEDKIIRSHGYSYFGDLSYPADYPHFNYVNPDAPKGGEISLAASGTFDTLNPYALKGVPGSGTSLLYESLLAEDPLSNTSWVPADAYGESYGLLAESLEYDEGKTWVIFHLRPEARFSDGTPVTAHDVVFSHNLFLEQGIPSYAEAVKKRVLTAEALDDHRVKFTFAEDPSRRSMIDQVGSTPVFSKAWYERTGAMLNESRLDPAIGSGPYVLESYDVGRQIVYRRNPDYWGWDLPVNKGRFNFDRIRIEYFLDDAATFESFKAGEYLFRSETSSKKWATAYDFPAVQNGHVVLEELPDGSPPGASGFVFNLGREKLKDKRVRQAIALAFNFEWTNASLQHSLFKQRNSFAQGTELEAKGPPEGLELELLKSLGDLVPSEMLTEPAVTAHSSNGKKLSDRRNRAKASKLLDEAGWLVGADGKRRNADGELLTLNFPIPAPSAATLGGIVENFMSNVSQLGITTQYETIDVSQFTLRRRERDYDMLFASYYPLTGAGTGLRQMYGSEAAAYSVFNPAGIASPLVDAIIDASLATESQAEEDAALRALDRALRYEFAMVPVWYNDKHWVAYWDVYDHPEKQPPYQLGVLDFWWYDAEKAAALKAAGVLR